LQDSVRQVCEVLKRQCLQIEGLQTQEHAGEQTKLMAKAMEELGRTSHCSLQQFEGKLREGAAQDVETMQNHFTKTLDDGGAIRLAMESIERRVDHWETMTKGEAKKWREQASTLEQQVAQLETVAGEVAAHQLAAERAKDESSELHRRVHGLETELGQMQNALEKASSQSLSNGMRRLKELESQGNVKVNRQSGEISLLRPLEFGPVKPTDPKPAPQFASAATAERLLQDVAELLALFETEADIEVHTKPPKGGTPAFWDEAAENSAKLIKAQLEQNGVAEERLNAKGLAGGKGLNNNVVVIRLSKEIFVEDAGAGGKAGGGAKRGASPGKAKGK